MGNPVDYIEFRSSNDFEHPVNAFKSGEKLVIEVIEGKGTGHFFETLSVGSVPGTDHEIQSA